MGIAKTKEKKFIISPEFLKMMHKNEDSEVCILVAKLKRNRISYTVKAVRLHQFPDGLYDFLLDNNLIDLDTLLRKR